MKITKNISIITARTLTTLVLLTAPVMMLWAQEMNEKFSMTTQMFLHELKEQPASVPHRAPGRRSSDGTTMRKARRLIASPDTVAGVAYISCFIHLKDASSLNEVRALGVEVEETFDGLDFVTARVPVNQLEALADIDNVTKIKVARQMRPLTDEARKVTNVDDLLTQSNDATALGITSKYDGTGVILGIIDTGIDFQHIAFKDKDGNSRIKRAYVYNGSSAQEYTSITSTSPTTDDNTEDHGTHTSSTAGGSSVIVSGSTVTVTDDHANATYGGIAPGADLYLAGIKGLYDTYLINALKNMVTYADSQGKPLVVSNSWGSGWGRRDGTGEWANLVGQYFGDSHPNRVILFAASNDAGHKNGNEGGGYFVKKSAVTNTSPLGTIIRTDEDGGNYYGGTIACAWNASNSTKLNCKLYVLDSSGAILKTSTITNTQYDFSELNAYYTGTMNIYIQKGDGKYQLVLYSEDGMQSRSSGSYTLAIEVYPESGSANINMWAGDWSFFTKHLTTTDHTWIEGTDDMCVSDEATIPNAISVGAYVSKKNWKAYNGSSYTSNVYTVGDIAYFSSYATADQSPTGLAYPWISAPGARLAAGVNHYHTASVDNYSYYGSKYNYDLVVNNNKNPYAMMEGTSMATPVAAGIVALWLQASMDPNAAHKNLTVNDVKTIMEQTAINDSYTTTGANASHFGKGKIDALAGIHYILGDSDKQNVTMSFSPTSATATIGEDFTEPTLTTNPSGLTVTYSSSKTGVATVDASTGKVTLVASGTTTITATFAGNDTYNGGMASYTLTIQSASTGSSNEFALVTSANEFVEGDYIIVYNGGAMNTTVSSNRLQYTDVTPVNNVITTDNTAIIWHIAPSGNYYTIYNTYESKYAAATGSNNQAQLLASGTDDKSLWSVTTGTTFDFKNKSNSRYLRRNGTFGFACYASGTGGALSLYKRTGSSTPVDPTADYYQSADGKKGEALKTAMCGIVYNRTEKSYDYLWTAFQTTDVRSDGKIWDMYSNITNYSPVTSGSSYSNEGDCYNREHSWPQSWFGSNTPMYTDLHHIYPTDGFVNGKRANYPFGETDGEDYKSANDFSKLGTCTYPGYTGTVFEPADEYKGDFARTYFYMVTCYEEKLPDWYTNYSSTDVVHVIDGSTYPALQEWQLNMLMEWAKNDPVSEKETARNNAVYAIQNNRNPFIDYPGLQEYIWGICKDSTFSYNNYVLPVYKQDVTMAFSPTEATATIGQDFTEPTLTTTPANLTVTYSSGEPSVATVNSSTGEVTLVASGTTTITATFAGNDSYNSGSTSYTLTVNEAVIPDPTGDSNYFELVTDASTLAAGDKILIAYVNGTTAKAMSATQGSNNRAAVDVTKNDDGTLTPDETAQIITLEKEGSNYLFNVGNGYLYAASSSKNYLRTETTADNNAKATISIAATTGNATITFQGTNSNNLLRYNPNGNSPIFSCYATNATTGSLPQIYRMIPTITLTFAPAGFCTYYHGKFDVTLPEGVKARIVTSKGNGEGALTYETIADGDTDNNIVPAGTAVMLQTAKSTEAQQKTLTLATPSAAAVSETNLLHGSDAGGTTTGDGKHYKLTYGNDNTPNANVFGWYWGATDGAAFNQAAHRAWLVLPYDQAGARSFFGLPDDDVVTSLSEKGLVNSEKSAPAQWYTLDGRKLSSKPAAKGVYIRGGRKVVVK